LSKQDKYFAGGKMRLFADLKHLGAAYRAHALGSRASVLHSYGFGAFHLSLGAAFNTITLHGLPPYDTYPQA
jgi:hypothetical protein